jgi:methylase of polypeptide subunit release factors
MVTVGEELRRLLTHKAGEDDDDVVRRVAEYVGMTYVSPGFFVLVQIAQTYEDEVSDHVGRIGEDEIKSITSPDGDHHTLVSFGPGRWVCSCGAGREGRREFTMKGREIK